MRLLKKYIDIKLIFLLGLAYLLMSLVSLVKNYYLKTHGLRFQFMDWTNFVINIHLYDWIYVVFFMTIIAASTKFMIEKKIRWIFYN